MDKLFIERLKILYPAPKSELTFSSTFELLVAVILSAQCTDKRVNIVTNKLFKVASTPAQFAQMPLGELEEHIKSINFFHNKAKNIISASRDIVSRFDGKVPSDMKELISLSGVGIKTASVVLASGFGIPAIPVDTHVLGWSSDLESKKQKHPMSCTQN